MPDVQEVFRMVTQQAKPDPGTLERQHRRQRRRTTRRRAGVYALVAALVIVAAALAVTLPKDATSPKIPGGTPSQTRPSAGTYELSVTTGAMTRLPISGHVARGGGISEVDVSPDGSQIAFTHVSGYRPQIWVGDLDGPDVRRVTHDPRSADFASWSPDGTKIAYAGFGQGGTDRSVFVVDLTTGTSTQLTDEPADVWRMDWSPDGERILYAVAIGGAPDPTETATGAIVQLRTVDVQTGQIQIVAGDREGLASEGRWSPDGSRIAFDSGIDSPTSLGFDPAEIWTMDTDGGNRALLLSIDAPAIGAEWSPDGASIAYTQADGDGANVYVVDVDSGESRLIGPGVFPTWLDEDTLIVEIQ
jgi:Tol biopolymer transport system component